MTDPKPPPSNQDDDVRHAYWRKPDGSLYRRDDDGLAPTSLLDQIGTRSKVTEEGQIEWHDFFTQQIETALFSSIAIVDHEQRELNETDSVEMVRESVHELIRESGGCKAIPPEALRRRVNKRAASFFARPRVKRRLVTSLSLEEFPWSSLVVDRIEISPGKRSDYPYPPFVENLESYVTPHLTSTKYKTVVLTSNEATIHQAFDKAMAVLNTVRGLWSFFATFKTQSRDYFNHPRRKWIGVALVGPVHTMHHATDPDVNLVYWFEPDYIEDAEVHSSKQALKLKDDVNWALSKIAKSPFASDLRLLFARYAVALDHTNHDVTLLMLWSLLEKITGGLGDKYETMIDKVAWIFTDRSLAKHLLTQMQWRRNNFVHAAGSSESRDQLCYITKHFIDEHLLRLLRGDFPVTSLKEYGEFLALPREPKRLELLVGWYQKALDMHKPAATTASGAGDPSPQS